MGCRFALLFFLCAARASSEAIVAISIASRIHKCDIPGVGAGRFSSICSASSARACCFCIEQARFCFLCSTPRTEQLGFLLSGARLGEHKYTWTGIHVVD